MHDKNWETLEPTFSLVEDRLRILKQALPEAFTDGKINFETLKELLGEAVADEEQDEHFGLSWTGKREARKLAGMPSKGTLVPVKGKGLLEDTTENIFIEGDNLEVLKLLHKSYYGKIKMIYIDPPYNTGNDFIYKDDYKMPLESYLQRSGQMNEMDEMLTSNPKSSGRFHSDWLNMIYPRLRIAVDLLSEDGVIFVSIDDNEVHNLRQMMNEIFGEENFVSTVVWEKRYSPQNAVKWFSESHDFVIVYAKNKLNWYPNLLERSDEMNARYRNLDNDPRGVWKPADSTAQGGHGTKSQFYVLTAPNGKQHTLPNGRCWLYTEPVFQQMVADNRIWFGTDGNNVPAVKRFLSEVKQGTACQTIWKYGDVGHNQEAKKEVNDLFPEASVFDTPKPVRLLKRILHLATVHDSLIVDFFSGSGTTAQAVMELNAEDGGNRKFICVQIDEKISEDSETYKAGFRTISEITAERIRRASKKIEAKIDAGLPLEQKPDLGFKFYRLERSNFKAWSDYQGTSLDELRGLLQAQVSTAFIPDATKEGILTEILLLEGFPLDSSISQDESFERNTVWRVSSEFSEHRLFVTLDDEIWEETITNAEELEPNDIFICLDKALSDESKIRLSDVCRLKVI
jgi:adenine-specific DNA-methyltransferase